MIKILFVKKRKIQIRGRNMIRICLCDDDPFWLELMKTRIENCIKNAKDIFSFSSCSSLEDLEKTLESKRVDVLFLDIMINKVNSADWLAENLKNHIFEVIFMTAYPEEAYSISEVDHAYFLVKSKINDEMIEKALNRVKDRIESRNHDAGTFRVNGRKITLKYADIVSFESYDNYVKIHTKDKCEHRIRATMNSCCKDLPPYFLRCHRGFAVNMNYIKAYVYSDFVMEDSTVVHIPPKKYAKTVEKYEEYLKNVRNQKI